MSSSGQGSGGTSRFPRAPSTGPLRGQAASPPPQTWHYGLIAKWWDEFNQGGKEIGYFQKFVERGQPALDLGCGTGRLLLPYLRAGMDVDGCDVSADMIELCRERGTREGLTPALYVQAMHELDLPRRYRTIFVCGAYGIGSTREQDLEALVRIHEHLEPGGTLVLDKEVPYADPVWWPYWLKEERARLPTPGKPFGERRRGSDGAEYALRTRIMACDPLSQSVSLRIRAGMWRDGKLVAEEERDLTENFYFMNELILMLDRAGFVDVDVRGDHTDEEPTADDDFLVFIARKAAAG